jgi:hypothetical protein
MEVRMTAVVSAGRVAARLPAWIGLAFAAAVALFWVVAFEGGAVSAALSGNAAWLHELFHDARHALGVPCH